MLPVVLTLFCRFSEGARSPENLPFRREGMAESRGKTLLKIAYVIFAILKLHDFFCDFFAILVPFSDFFRVIFP